jgi:hypothetical protein
MGMEIDTQNAVVIDPAEINAPRPVGAGHPAGPRVLPVLAAVLQRHRLEDHSFERFSGIVDDIKT